MAACVHLAVPNTSYPSCQPASAWLQWSHHAISSPVRFPANDLNNLPWYRVIASALSNTRLGLNEQPKNFKPPALLRWQAMYRKTRWGSPKRQTTYVRRNEPNERR